jgi:arginine decarboxylase
VLLTARFTTTLGRFTDLESTSELGRAQRRAAEAYRVPRATFQVNGSTGANAVALRAHLLHGGRLRALVACGAHHSIVNEVVAIGGSLRFVRGAVDARFEAALPPTPSMIDEALATRGTFDLVVITSPTYEGLNARVAEIAETVHRHGARLHVDCAWGPLLGFHDTLPGSPVALGADSAAISVHKLGGALSQAALLTWSENCLDPRAVRAAHNQYCTTSPNYLLAASIDQAILDLRRQGQEAIEMAIARRERLRRVLTDALPGLEVLDGRPRVADFGAHLHAEHPLDRTRLTIGLGGYRPTGYAVAHALTRAGIVPEKAGVQTLTLLVPMEASDELPERVGATIVAELEGRTRGAEARHADLPAYPVRGLIGEPEIEPSVAGRRVLVDGAAVPLGDAVGLICLELVEAFPPGIPIGVPGFRLAAEAVACLEAVKTAGGSIVCLDPDPDATRIIVLPEERAPMHRPATS